MKFQVNRAKPFIYAIVALLGFYAIFSMRQSARAQSRDNRGVQNRRQDRRNNQNNNRTEQRQNRNNSSRENTSQRNQNSRNNNQTANTNNQNPQANTGNFRERYEAAGTREQDRMNRESSSFGFFQITFILIILGAIAYLVYKFVSKRKEGQVGATDYINVLGTTPLAANKHLQVVQIFDNIFILGVGENSVNLITEVTDKNLISQIRDEALARLPSLSFKEQIMKFINKMKPGSSMKNDPEEEALDYFKKHREKLNNLNGNNKDEDGL